MGSSASTTFHANAARSSSGGSADPFSQWLSNLPTATLRLFQSVPLAVVLLSGLAIGILIGVFLPQENLVDPLEIKAQYGEQYTLMKAMGLFNVYSAPWFMALEALFFFNLLSGSFKWLRPAWNSATQVSFLDKSFITMSEKGLSPVQCPQSVQDTTEVLKNTLKRQGYTVHVAPQKANSAEQRIYANRGNWSRLGPAVAHVGILMILLSSLYGSFTGFKAQKIGIPGQSFTIEEAETLTRNTNPDVWLGSIPDWTFSVKDFRIAYYPDHPGTVKQYYCDLEVLDKDGTPLASETISVNHPLSLGDVTVYQASFVPTGKLHITLNGTPQTVEINNQFQDRQVAMVNLPDQPGMLVLFPFFVQQDGVPEDHIRAFLHTGNGFSGAAPGKMPDNLKLTTGQTGTLGPVTLGFDRPQYATGLQIKKAPEVPWIYLSFAIVCLGTVMCFFAQRQLWFSVTPSDSAPQESAPKNNTPTNSSTNSSAGSTILVFPKTNKARHSFKAELQRLHQQLTQALRAS